ncbi:hypothetical protein DN589_13900 [Klebsiella quasipneumoniae subsp. similipneumoniae]|nr:hypothetical protein DN589_13900 [Klebsiella quasipneumoniae subsp. similipneumoniae]
MLTEPALPVNYSALMYLRAASAGRVSVAPPGKITAQQGCVGGNQCLPGGAACIADTVIGMPLCHSGNSVCRL